MKKNKKRRKTFIVVAVVLLLCLGGYIYYSKNKDVENPINNILNKEEEKPKLKIIDTNSKTRPYAVMINNISTARPYQSGLQDAYIIYEIIVEGGITRYMALFKDQNTERIGSVRSARHYFIDYALENDAYYVHWGWSPQAESDINSLNIDNINGLTYEGTYFYRDKTLKIPTEHTGFTSMDLLNKAVDKLNYRSVTNKDLLLNYSIDEIDLSSKEGVIPANNVSITYSRTITSSYTYDANNKYYLRSVNETPEKDYVTKEQYHFKNIITYQVVNNTIANDNKDRQTINNIGSGTGYYITDGYAMPIKWEKKSRSSQTIYTYNDGTKINVNDGNTFIQIQPTGESLNIN
jgi:hypothetical protein